VTATAKYRHQSSERIIDIAKFTISDGAIGKITNSDGAIGQRNQMAQKELKET
jgi:ribosomal protein L18E